MLVETSHRSGFDLRISRRSVATSKHGRTFVMLSFERSSVGGDFSSEPSGKMGVA